VLRIRSVCTGLRTKLRTSVGKTLGLGMVSQLSAGSYVLTFAQLRARLSFCSDLAKPLTPSKLLTPSQKLFSPAPRAKPIIRCVGTWTLGLLSKVVPASSINRVSVHRDVFRRMESTAHALVRLGVRPSDHLRTRPVLTSTRRSFRGLFRKPLLV
jgi:hypothetical protein